MLKLKKPQLKPEEGKENRIKCVGKSDQICELLVAFTFIGSFILGVMAGNVDANMSALLVTGISTISDMLSEKYMYLIDPTGEKP